jgi:hypothetical protein
MNDLKLKEIPLLSRRYTWSIEREAPTHIQLDRALCMADWEALYPASSFQVKPQRFQTTARSSLVSKEFKVKKSSILRVFG